MLKTFDIFMCCKWYASVNRYCRAYKWWIFCELKKVARLSVSKARVLRAGASCSDDRVPDTHSRCVHPHLHPRRWIQPRKSPLMMRCNSGRHSCLLCRRIQPRKCALMMRCNSGRHSCLLCPTARSTAELTLARKKLKFYLLPSFS